LARSFLQQDLVDELFIGLGPVLLGDGIPPSRANSRSAILS
jgi:riboflavin biosynthesis pyrimidine reductase